MFVICHRYKQKINCIDSQRTCQKFLINSCNFSIGIVPKTSEISANLPQKGSFFVNIREYLFRMMSNINIS